MKDARRGNTLCDVQRDDQFKYQIVTSPTLFNFNLFISTWAMTDKATLMQKKIRRKKTSIQWVFRQYFVLCTNHETMATIKITCKNNKNNENKQTEQWVARVKRSNRFCLHNLLINSRFSVVHTNWRKWNSYSKFVARFFALIFRTQRALRKRRGFWECQW